MNPHYSVITFFRAALLVMFALLIGACGSASRLPPAPTTAETAPVAPYKIASLDTLNVVVWRNPELSTAVTVRPDGRISLPLVEDMPAAGRNPVDLSRDIEKALSKYIKDPVVTIIVSGFQGNYGDQVRVVGEAVRPQAVPYRQNMTLLDVMIQAGGITDFADGNGAVLVRGGEGGKQYSIRLKDLLKRGDVSANVEVKPGDAIIIPQGWF